MSDDKLHIEDPVARKRVQQMTIQMVTKMVADGKLDENDETAVKAAVRQCACDALAAYYAALEFIGG